MDANFEAGAEANREYKDSVFTLLFNDEKAAVEVYGAISGTRYGPDVKVKITTLKKVLSSGMFNDVAFVLEDKLVVLIEHQSTINENMPLRMLLYIAETYNRLSNDEDLYSRKMFSIPRPEFIVLYNGAENVPDKQVLRLSDMFKNADEAGNTVNLELTVTVYNINKGRNPEMARRSPTLDGYETFVFIIRENQKTMSLEEAIKKAVLDCIKQNVLKNFLENHKKEVIGMLLHEWDWGKAMEVAKREAVEEAVEAATKKQAVETARSLRARGMGVDEVADITKLTVDDILRL